jgi:hypothetical protein
MEAFKDLKESLDYDPLTGVFTWKVDRPAEHFLTEASYKNYLSRFAGKRAGCIVKYKGTSYRQIRVNKTLYMEHRLALYFGLGVWPERVDHKDGDGLNNALTNLQPACAVVNGKNCRLSTNNTSGVNGVYFHKQSNKWVAEAHWTENGSHRKKSLGSYILIEEAKEARRLWESANNYTQRHGK